ncbi:hypothetical protein EV368DRAFT_90179, partial [Lentinula lateritia]
MDINLKDGEGRQVKVEAMVDDGAMVAAMDTRVYEYMREAMGGWTSTRKKFRMANSSVIPGTVCWTGCVSIQGVEVEGAFEVFDSGGSWKFLFGKPLLERFAAVHDYQRDSIVLQGRKGNIREVFNKGLGTEIAPTPTPSLGKQNEWDIPSPPDTVQVVLEESMGPLGGVIVKTLTPLDREVKNLLSIEWEPITDTTGQHVPRSKPPTRRLSPQIEEIPDEDLEQTRTKWNTPPMTPELPTGMVEEDWKLWEAKMKAWFEESRRIRREEAIKHQEMLEQRQRERRKAWELEEEQQDAEWKEWLRKRRAEPGLRKWFFWRNRLKELNPPRRLSVNLPGGHNASPSREVSQDAAATDGTRIDLAFAECQPCDMEVVPLKNPLDGEEEAKGGENAKSMPDGMRASSVGGFEIPPSREVPDNSLPATPHLADQTHIAPICVLQAETYPNLDSLGPDFFPDALDQSDDVNLFTRNDGENGAFRPERVKEILRK